MPRGPGLNIRDHLQSHDSKPPHICQIFIYLLTDFSNLVNPVEEEYWISATTEFQVIA